MVLRLELMYSSFPFTGVTETFPNPIALGGWPMVMDVFGMHQAYDFV